MTSPPLLLKNGRIIDPINNRDEISNLLVANGKCHYPNSTDSLPENTRIIDVKGAWIVPGLIDIHVHLRQPGEEYKETIESGAKAGAVGGFTALACMPNTNPVIDNEQLVASLIKQAANALIRVYPVGAISKNSAGDSLADFGEMMRAGAVAFSDDGQPVTNSQLMRRALEYASSYQATIISHSEEATLSHNGAMNEGAYSTQLGLPGIPRVAEEIAVYRDLALADYTGNSLHLAHISTKESVALIRRAKANGCPVTAETAPHYFSLTEEAIATYNTYAKMNPPLRTAADVAAIKEGLQDGTIDVIATDHAPHSDLEKAVEFDLAANGIIGLETSLSLTLELVRQKIITPTRLVELMSVNPARILSLPGGHLSDGAIADVTIISPDKKYVYEHSSVVSKSKNSPFLDQEMTGKAILTLVNGKIVYNNLD